jgi:hypothetical protein
MAKSLEIARLVEKRIRYGDYNLKPIPAERELAAETGVTKLTARRALLRLVDKGLLGRLPNGRLTVQKPSRGGGKGQLRLAFLAPAFPSYGILQWHLAIQKTAERMGASIRPVYYVHWDDPIICDTLAGFDGVFLVPTSEPIRPEAIERFRAVEAPLAFVCGDWTAWGIPSVTGDRCERIQQVLDYLGELGHRHIDCLNTQPMDWWMDGLIEQWNIWRAAHGCAGRLINDPVRPYEWAPHRAREVVGRLLNAKTFHATALFCVTEPAATGAIRAFHDRGMQVGRDVSVAVGFDEGLAQIMVPSLTSLERLDIGPLLAICVEWMQRGGKDWVGPLLVEGPRRRLFKGESTGRVDEV